MSGELFALALVAVVVVVLSPFWWAALDGRRPCPRCPHRRRDHIARTASCLADGSDGSLFCGCHGPHGGVR